jgi:hypothetical protein
MGVDIYLKSVFDPDSEWPLDLATGINPIAAINAMYVRMEATGGYFRNAYNNTNVMWVMGLDWGRTVEPMLQGQNRNDLPIECARELVTLIEAQPLSEERLVDHFFSTMTDGVDPSPGTGRLMTMLAEGRPIVPPAFEDWAKFVHRKRETLLALLHKSIELSEPLVCSL